MKSTNSLQEHKRKDKIKWILLSILLALFIGAFVVMGVTLNKQITTKTLGVTAYSIGTLDEGGEYVKDTSTIYTKDFVTVNGLQIKVAEKAGIQYKLYFYGENAEEEKEFISATEYLTADFSGTIPTNAKFVKIVIDPLEDENVSIFEKWEYARRLEVTYNK